MSSLFEDLRSFIGVFFVIIGTLLIAQGLLHPEETAGYNLNLIAGVSFVIFGLFSLGLALLALKRSR